MAQRPTVEPPASHLLDMHPAIQATLNCMDVQMEDELARYRRAQRRSPARSQPAATPGAVAMGAGGAAALAIASTLPLPDAPETVAQQPTPGFVPPTPAADSYEYMESSEHLLRSLAEDEAELRQEPAPRMLDTLLTPLGIGSMILLLLSSVTLGYVLTNPASLPFMGTQAEAPEDESLMLEGSEPTTPAPGNASSGNTSFSPDLSSQEFRSLNLDTLSTLPEDQPLPEAPVTATGTATQSTAPSSTSAQSGSAASTQSQPTPTSSSPSAAPTASSTAAPAARPQPAPAPAPRPQAAAPAPAPRPQAPAPAPAPAPSRSPAPVAAAPTAASSSYFYVITDYTGDRALEAAQSAMGDAYVRNFDIGAVIQFGAFSEADRAESLIQDLQQQGISARIHRVERN